MINNPAPETQHLASTIATIYYRLDGALHHWTLRADPDIDTPACLATHLSRWIPGAEFVECKFEKVRQGAVNPNVMVLSPFEMAASNLLARATRIQTIEGHVLQRFADPKGVGLVWFAYPKSDPKARTSVLSSPHTDRHLEFASAIEAYAACVEAGKKGEDTR